LSYAFAPYFALLYIAFILSMGGMCYYLGRRKTQTPVLAGILGTMLSIMPPLGLVYLAVLVLKNDVNSSSAAVSR
jgi:EamA domain-containing membrane protein RarD